MDYAKGAGLQPRRWLIALLVCAIFAASDFGSEYLNQRIYLRRLITSTNPSPRQLQRLEDNIVNNLLIELVYTVWATLILFMGILLAFGRKTAVTVLRVTFVAIGAGVVYCETRWIIWLLRKALPFEYTERVDLIVATALAILMTAIILRWFCPSQRHEHAPESKNQPT